MPLADVLGIERRPSGRSFRIHTRSLWEPVRVRVRRSKSRIWELELRRAHVRIVDEYGAMIDESQFEKEADRSFAKRRYPHDPRFWDLVIGLLTPKFVYRKRWNRYQRELRLDNLRQSYDDAEGEPPRG